MLEDGDAATSSSNRGGASAKRPPPPPPGNNRNTCKKAKYGNNNNNNTRMLCCATCKESKGISEFSSNQRKKQGKNEGAKCHTCCVQLQQPKKKKVKTKNGKAATSSSFAMAQPQTATTKATTKTKTLNHEANFRTAPRPCSKCGIVKAKECFSAHQWNSVGGVVYSSSSQPKFCCLECLPLEVEQKSMQDENWKQAEQEVFLPLYKKHGILFYEFPEWSDLLASKFSRRDEMEEHSLEGCYDILFHMGYCDDDLHSERTTRGTLTLTARQHCQSLVDSGPTGRHVQMSSLVGRIEFDKGLPLADALCFNSDYTITEDYLHQIQDDTNGSDSTTGSNSSSRSVWKQVFTVGGYAVNTIDLINPEEEGMRAEMYILQERVACPWRPVEGGHDVQELSREFGADKIVTFDSVQQAQTLVEQHYNREDIVDGEDSNCCWLCRHPFNLPADVAKRILCFAQSRPSPRDVFRTE
jgi:hypothetical protein